jgi:hypothetical protein
MGGGKREGGGAVPTVMNAENFKAQWLVVCTSHFGMKINSAVSPTQGIFVFHMILNNKQRFDFPKQNCPSSFVMWKDWQRKWAKNAASFSIMDVMCFL